ncbi:YhbY family RNA-binding protein [Aeropyrum pernix]|uniref:YhbY family RNA-binding protein n=1 Tax=Aeropyrum pernix TaxID=56636 RepID=UPI001FB5363B|nr:YhbY family RNA-binding protein [Aeropyrum pernix]
MRTRVRRAHHGRADVIIGKAGVTREVLREIDARLEKKEVVKVKMLKTALKREEGGRRELARRVAGSLGARLMGVRGYTFILYRPRRGGSKVKRPSRRLLGSWVE